jgi:hypothetical protein
MSDLGSVYSNPNDAQLTDDSQPIKRSLWGDRLIGFRESILDLITRSNKVEVLNAGAQVSKEADKELPADLKRFIDMAKIDSMDEDGFTVDYERLRSSSPYSEYRESCSPRLRNFDPQILTTRQEKLAFWINLYNTLVMDGVISKHVTQSVGSNSFKILAFFRQTSYNVSGYRMSCDDIEHGILRANRGHPKLPGRQFPSSDFRNTWVIDPVDVRIHFALNCTGRSCPPIQVYTAENIDDQLNLAARNFVNSGVKIDTENEKVHLSAIFSWFKEDFGGRNGIIEFLIEYLPDDDRKSWLLTHRETLKFEFKDYDWGLNSSNLQMEN